MTTAFYSDERCFWHGGGNYAGMVPVGGLVQPLLGGLPESPESKRRLKNLIEVTGLVRRSDMQPQGPSTTIGGMRVTVGGSSPTSMDPTRSDPTRQAMTNVVYMDVSGFRVLENSCPKR